MSHSKLWVLGLVLGLIGAPPARAADHRDGPAVVADPAADINDLFAWTSPAADRIHLVMTVFPFAGEAARFSDAVQYVFHTTSQAAFGADETSGVDIVCEFDSAQTIVCRIGDQVSVSGEASDPGGLASDDGRLRVFAGRRGDPFFFNLSGFSATADTVAGAAGGLSFDAAGCPMLDGATSNALVAQLQAAPGGGPPMDDFLGAAGLALVVSIDKTLLTESGPIVGVWASTNRQLDAGVSCLGDTDADGRVTVDEIVMVVNNALLGCTVVPSLGMQIERMGRAGINTAVVDPFNLDDAAHGGIQDSYNAAVSSTQWQAFAGRMAGNLAILDSLDTNCGNQLLAGPNAEPGRYDALAGVLADDRVYVNTESGSCGQYLAVEANALGITNNDCGGRTPLYDTIDTSYSVLAAGILSGVGDGIPNDADGAASLADFPFLLPPS